MAGRRKVRAGKELVFANGARAATVARYRKELEGLTPRQSAHRASAERNDVATWIRDFLDPKPAARIQGLRMREALLQGLLG